MKPAILLALLLFSFVCQAQYAPAAGQPGSTAIAKDSSIFVKWATSAIVSRGWVNAQDTSLGKATYGIDNNALGIADNSTVSLGDGGLAVLTFDNPIVDGPSWDFAVFENSFDDYFLELAFVEVSSDGQHYVRFPSNSLTQTDSQVTSFGTLEAARLNNLAGKYKGGYGTPFDLSELNGSPYLDIQNINYIRIIDVVGSIDSNYASYDTANNPINDPFPTPFPSGGFDLDAVGIIHQSVGFSSAKAQLEVSIFPNPCNELLYIKTNSKAKVEIYNMLYQVVVNKQIGNGINKINTSSLSKGVYIVNIVTDFEKTSYKLVIDR
jgi:hypothetical protein